MAAIAIMLFVSVVPMRASANIATLIEPLTRLTIDMAKSIGDITASIRKAIEEGAAAVDFLSTRSHAEDLRALVRELLDLQMEQTILIEDKLKVYIDNPDPEIWWSARSKLTDLAGRVTDVANRLDEVGNKFSYKSPEIYRKLRSTITGRKKLINKLRAVPPPTSPEELEALKTFVIKYGKLIRELYDVSSALAKFIRQHYDQPNASP